MENPESVGELSEFYPSTTSSQEQRLHSGDKLIFSADLFSDTLGELRERSSGYRESAAIWVGKITGHEWHAERAFFHHQLCDDHAGPLFLELSEKAKFSLYQQLAEEQLSIIALLHTHPDEWVGLSDIDQRNQLSSRLGFWSIVVPHYAQEPVRLSDFGVHVRTNYGWYQLQPGEASTNIIVTI